MPTAVEIRVQAKECLELANTASEFYVRSALKDLAQRFNRQAHQAERRARDMGALSNLQASSQQSCVNLQPSVPPALAGGRSD